MTIMAHSATTSGVRVPEGWVAGTWTIDPAHSMVSFSVRHLMSRVRGGFSEVSGRIVTGSDPAGSSVSAEIAAASISTGTHMRDDHLRSADFLDAGRYPVMTFSGGALRPAGGGWVLAGELTIRDVTRPLDLEVEFLGSDPTGLQGEPRVGFSALTSISRRDFGITFGLVGDGAKIIVADTIDIALDVQAFAAA
jgi:polyisoprenoid-binding protein YceI